MKIESSLVFKKKCFSTIQEKKNTVRFVVAVIKHSFFLFSNKSKVFALQPSRKYLISYLLMPILNAIKCIGLILFFVNEYS